MYFDELLQKAYVKAEEPEEGEIVLLPSGFKPAIELNMVLSKTDFESVLMAHRANEPASEAVLTTIGTECRAGTTSEVAPQVWDMLASRTSVLDRYTHLCNEQVAGSLGELESQDSQGMPGSQGSEEYVPSFEDLGAYKQDPAPQLSGEDIAAPAGDAIVIGASEDISAEATHDIAPAPVPAVEQTMPSPEDIMFQPKEAPAAPEGISIGDPAPEDIPSGLDSFGIGEDTSTGLEGFGGFGAQEPVPEEAPAVQPEVVPAPEVPNPWDMPAPTAEAIGGLGNHVDPWDVEDTMTVSQSATSEVSADAPQAAAPMEPALTGFEGFGFEMPAGEDPVPSADTGFGFGEVPAEAPAPAVQGMPTAIVGAAGNAAPQSQPQEQTFPADAFGGMPAPQPADMFGMPAEAGGDLGAFGMPMQPEQAPVQQQPQVQPPVQFAGSIPNEELKVEPENAHQEELKEIQDLFDLFFTRCKEYGVERIIGSSGDTAQSYAQKLVGQFPALGEQLSSVLQTHQGKYDAVVLDLISILRAEAETSVKRGDLESGMAYGQPVYSILYE